MHINPDVVFRVLGDGAVLVHLPSNDVYELNTTAAAVWDLVARQQPLDAIVADITRQFDVDDAAARAQCDTLITDLLARGLLLP